MSNTTLDLLYYGFIALVIIGGIIAIIILCPKENKLREQKKDSYRFLQQNGRLVLSNSMPSLFEKWTGKPVYIEKGPFEIEAFFDNIKGADENSYRTGAIIQLYLPESGAETAAEYLYSVLSDFSQDAITAMLRMELEGVVAAMMKKYENGADMKVFNEDFRNAVLDKLGKFGYDLYCPPTLKIVQNN
ncbi:MAG: hypothetical protein IJ385_04720 [Ruminiclostridium sp.]|nr:hypothetical protein [Ruminiclostridium sp.]